MTLHDKYVVALARLGSKVVENARTRKYTVVSTPILRNPPVFYFIGKSGAVRFGRTITSSVSLDERRKARLLADAQLMKVEIDF